MEKPGAAGSTCIHLEISSPSLLNNRYHPFVLCSLTLPPVHSRKSGAAEAEEELCTVEVTAHTPQNGWRIEGNGCLMSGQGAVVDEFGFIQQVSPRTGDRTSKYVIGAFHFDLKRRLPSTF